MQTLASGWQVEHKICMCECICICILYISARRQSLTSQEANIAYALSIAYTAFNDFLEKRIFHFSNNK